MLSINNRHIYHYYINNFLTYSIQFNIIQYNSLLFSTIASFTHILLFYSFHSTSSHLSTLCSISIICLFHITSISPYCTGVSCPVQAMLNHLFIMVQNGLYLLFSLFISFSTTFGMSLSKTSFRVSPLTAFLSILRVTIP